uniref:Neuroendocrine protein 7B2 n=1 Tax=Schistosoma japonicum TaxID=6182 RepID=C1LHR4_SCHJA|nr:Neuroendocrine 7B2 precursor [Schistosoma japonicum]
MNQIKPRILFLLVLLIDLYDRILASNYDQYIDRLTNDGKLLYDDYIKQNPSLESALERVYTLQHPIFQEDYPGNYEITDKQWNAFLNEIDQAKLGRLQNNDADKPEMTYSNLDRKSNYELYPNTNNNNDKVLNQPSLTERRNEIAYQNPLWGEHKVTGGSSETGQWIDYALLGAGAQDLLDNESSVDNFNLSNEIESFHIESKVDNLPAYCDPPNPCPLNYKSHDLPSPCDHGIEDTIEFNRNWIIRKMENGECSCDNEHMDSCPIESNENGDKNNFVSAQKADRKPYWVNPYLRGESRKRLVAKKRVKRSHVYHYNPYLMGSVHKTAVKKIGPYKPSHEKYM